MAHFSVFSQFISAAPTSFLDFFSKNECQTDRQTAFVPAFVYVYFRYRPENRSSVYENHQNIEENAKTIQCTLAGMQLSENSEVLE